MLDELPLWLTPMQAVAWISTRHLGVVWRADLERGHEALGDEPSEVIDACFPSRGGVSLCSLDLWNGLHPECALAVSSEEACNQLVLAFRAGKVRTVGVDADGMHHPIDPCEWCEMTLAEPLGTQQLAPHRASQGSDVFTGEVRDRGQAPIWNDVRVARDDLFQRYSPRKAVVSSEERSMPARGPQIVGYTRNSAIAKVAYGDDDDGRYVGKPGVARANAEAESRRRRKLDLLYPSTSGLPGTASLTGLASEREFQEKLTAWQENDAKNWRDAEQTVQRREAVRQQRIDSFRDRQLRSREWISFADIADWCARESGSILPDEQRRAATYTALRDSLAAGIFEVDGRARVLFLKARTKMVKLTRESLAFVENLYDEHIVRLEYMAYCWIPRDLCQAWFEAKRLNGPTWLFSPPAASGGIGATAARHGASGHATLPKTKRGRRPRYPWPRILTGLGAKLAADGFPEPGDGGQAGLEKWVAEQFPENSCPSESVIREQVAKAIEAHRKAQGVEAGNSGR